MMNSPVPVNHSGNSLHPHDWGSFGSFYSDPWLPFRQMETETFRLDMKEDHDNYIIEADLPGVKKRDISLSLACGYLTISVDRKEDDDGDKKTLYKERRHIRMDRSIFLAGATDSGAKAKLQNGELVITIPKQHKGISRQAIAIE